MALSYVTLDFGTVPPPITKRAVGTVNVDNLGWYTWNFGAHESPIKPINFAQSILFCPYPNAQGINTYMATPATYNYALHGRDGTALGIKIGTQSLNLAAGILDALNLPTAFTAGTDGDFDRPSMQPAYSAGPRLIGQTPPIDGTMAKDDTVTHSRTYKMYLVLVQMASEIAQWTIMRDQNTTVASNTIPTGFTYVPAPAGTVRQLDIDLSATPTQSVFKFGKTGLFKVGYVSFEYNGFYSEVQYINQVSQKFFPPAPGATGVGIWLEKPITGTYGLGYLSALSEAMNTSLGTLGLLSGQLSSIVP